MKPRPIYRRVNPSRFTCRAHKHRGNWLVSITQPGADGLRLQLTERQARQLWTSMSGSLDWIGRSEDHAHRRIRDLEQQVAELQQQTGLSLTDCRTPEALSTHLAANAGSEFTVREPGDLIEDPDGNPLGMTAATSEVFTADEDGHLTRWVNNDD